MPMVVMRPCVLAAAVAPPVLRCPFLNLGFLQLHLADAYLVPRMSAREGAAERRMVGRS